jgi:hypothetical protein
MQRNEGGRVSTKPCTPASSDPSLLSVVLLRLGSERAPHLPFGDNKEDATIFGDVCRSEFSYGATQGLSFFQFKFGPMEEYFSQL